MKYVAVCVLSIATMLSASASPSAQSRISPTTTTPLFAPAHLEPATAEGSDSLLMLVLGGALISLQLRRRQKSLRSPRTLILGS